MRHPEESRPLPIDIDHIAFGIGFDRAIDIHDVGSLEEHRFELPTDSLLLFVVRAINFGNDRRHDRRTGWHFGDLYRCTEFAANRR